MARTAKAPRGAVTSAVLAGTCERDAYKPLGYQPVPQNTPQPASIFYYHRSLENDIPTVKRYKSTGVTVTTGHK